MILTITTTDANNMVNLCALAVVDEECCKSYMFLLRRAMRNKQMEKFIKKASTTCFTDSKKGSDRAMAKLAPLAEVRHCVQHIIRAVGITGKVR